jgi:hypothetical protein
MSSRIRKFLKGQQSGGGNRSADFLKVSNDGKYVLRLMRFEDDFGYTFMSHKLGPKESDICQKSVHGDGAHCEHCEDVAVLYAENTKESKKQANGLRAKPRTWLCAVDTNGQAGGGPEAFGILEFSGFMIERILGVVAQVGGWSGDYDFEDEDCLDRLEAGIEKCFGDKGRDLLVKTNTKGGSQNYYKFSFSQRPGKKLGVAEKDAPNMEELWLRIKAKIKDDDDEDDAPKKRRKPSAAKTKARPKAKAKGKAKSKKKAPAKRKAPAKKKAAAKRKRR